MSLRADEHHHFTELRMDSDEQTYLRFFTRNLNIYPRYIYPVDVTGRVVGNRLPPQATLKEGIDRLLVVGPYEEHYYKINRS